MISFGDIVRKPAPRSAGLATVVCLVIVALWHYRQSTDLSENAITNQVTIRVESKIELPRILSSIAERVDSQGRLLVVRSRTASGVPELWEFYPQDGTMRSNLLASLPLSLPNGVKIDPHQVEAHYACIRTENLRVAVYFQHGEVMIENIFDPKRGGVTRNTLGGDGMPYSGFFWVEGLRLPVVLTSYLNPLIRNDEGEVVSSRRLSEFTGYGSLSADGRGNLFYFNAETNRVVLVSVDPAGKEPDYVEHEVKRPASDGLGFGWFAGFSPDRGILYCHKSQRVGNTFDYSFPFKVSIEDRYSRELVRIDFFSGRLDFVNWAEDNSTRLSFGSGRGDTILEYAGNRAYIFSDRFVAHGLVDVPEK